MCYNTSVAAVFDLDAAIRQLQYLSVGSNLGNAASAHIFSVVRAVGIIASLIFMWSIRYSRIK